MIWFAETHGIKFELVRHFWARLFDSEMFSTRGQWQTVAVSALGLAVPAGLLLLDPPYWHRAIAPTAAAHRAVAVADQLALFTFVFAITGVLTLIAWQSLFPSRRDYLTLAGLPVRPRQIFVARFLTVALLGLAIVIAMSALPAIMPAHLFTTVAEPGVSFVRSAGARVAVSWLGCLFIFFSITAVQGLLLNILPPRWFTRISTNVQGVLRSRAEIT